MKEKEECNNTWTMRQAEYEINNILLGQNLICISCDNKYEIDSYKIRCIIEDIKKGFIPKEIVPVGVE